MEHKIKVEEDTAIEVHAEGMRIGINENELSLEFGEIKQCKNKQIGIIKAKIKINPKFLGVIINELTKVGELYKDKYKKEIADLNTVTEE